MFFSHRRPRTREPTMNRPIVCVAIFAAMSAGGCNPPAAPQELALEVKMADEVDRVKAAEKKPEKPKAEPAPVRPPVVLKRWPLPAWLQPADKGGYTIVAIDPSGPSVVARSAAGVFSWNAAL